MTFLSSINISQIPAQYEGRSTYSNDLIYQVKPAKMTHQDCKDYLARKISQLKSKLTIKEAALGHRRRWANQLEVYEAILNYLSLHKF
jgi:hypothetical protein